MAVGGMGRGFGSDRSNKNKFLVGEVMGELVRSWGSWWFVVLWVSLEKQEKMVSKGE
jgi:hypothetical protein